MAKIICNSQYMSRECSNCRALITGDIEYSIDGTCIYHKAIIHISPYKCRNCKEFFEDIVLISEDNERLSNGKDNKI